ncbi:MAG: hypothetical protein ACYC41_03045 [Bacillota bacterium]
MELLDGAHLETVDAEKTEAEARQEQSEAKTQLSAVQAQADKENATVNPPGYWYISGWAYPLSLSGLAALDVPLVYLAFLAFGLDVAQTFLLSALVGVLICSGGHFTGTLLRRRRGSEWLHLLAAAVPALGLVLAVSFLRENGFAVILSDQAVLNPGRSFLGLLMINLGSLSVAFLLASHHRLEQKATELRKANRALRQANRAAGRASVRRRKRQRAEKVLEHRLEAEPRLEAADLHVLKSSVDRWISLYVAANVRAREPHQLVDCLKVENLPRLKLPDDLAPTRKKGAGDARKGPSGVDSKDASDDSPKGMN